MPFMQKIVYIDWGEVILLVNHQGVVDRDYFHFFIYVTCLSPIPPTRKSAFLLFKTARKKTYPMVCLFSWLGRSDSNTRMTESESVALPLGDAPLCRNLHSLLLALFYQTFFLLASIFVCFSKLFSFFGKKTLFFPFFPSSRPL